MNEKQLNDIKHSLDQSADEFDAATLSRLRQAREAALDAADKKSAGFMFPLPAVLATVCFLAVGTFFLSNSMTPPETNDYQQVVNEIILDDSMADALVSEDLEVDFYEDFEFYEWLDSNEINEG